jgi:cytoskeletal protein CcmA (bactofilin family)
MLPFLALLAVTLLWFLLPLLPALRELLRPSDIAPLKVVDRSSGHVAYFARNFRQYLDKALPPAAGVGDYAGKMLDGTEYIRVNLHPGALLDAEQRVQNRIVILDTPLTLEAGGSYLMELYARAPLVGGAKSVFRAVYAEGELVLGEGSQVLRWAHAGGKLNVGAHSVLRGRVSSDVGVSLGGDVVFERIGAPVISVGAEQDPPPPPPAAPQSFRLPDGARQIGDHVRIEGDLEIPEGVLVGSSLVVAGRLRIGMGTIVQGSVKAHRDIELADEAQVAGSVVSRTRLMLGQAAWIGGAAIAEQRIRLGRGAVVGSPERPATVAAPEIELSKGATVYGQISAMRGARTF